jgi:hypothetical protein
VSNFVCEDAGNLADCLVLEKISLSLVTESIAAGLPVLLRTLSLSIKTEFSGFS